MSEAIEHFESLLQRHGGAAKAPDILGALDVRRLAAELKHLALGDLSRALAIANALGDAVCRDMGDQAQVLSARAHVLCYANRFEEALGLIDIASGMAAQAGSRSDAAQVHLAAVQPLARAGRLVEAEHAAREALRLYSESADGVGQGKSWLNLGIVHRMRDRSGDALEALDRASDLIGDDAMLRGALASNRAECLLDLDRFTEAEESFVEAMRSFEQAGNEHGLAIVEGNLADLLSQMGRLDAALERFERSRRRYLAHGAEADAARLGAEEAEALASLGALEPAIRAYTESIPRLEAAHLRMESERSRVGFGLALLRGGRAQHAEELLMATLRETKSVVISGVCLVAMASIMIRDGRRLRGAAMARDAQHVLRGREARLARAHAEFAGAWLDVGKIELARHHIDALARANDHLGIAALSVQSLDLLGRLRRAERRAQDACDVLRRAVLEAESLRGSLRAEQWRLAHGESWRRLYLEGVGAALDCGRFDLAFDTLERLRARSLLDAIGATRRRAREPDALMTELAAFSDELSVLYGRLDVSEPGQRDETLRGATRERIAVLESKSARLRDRISAMSPSLGGQSAPEHLHDCREALAADQAVVVYFAEGSELSSVVVRPGGVEAVRGFAGLSEVESLLRRLRFRLDDLLASPRADSDEVWDSVMSRLYEHVFQPMLPLLDGARQLGISSFGPLLGLPWCALPVAGGLLNDRFEIAIVPSVSTAMRLAGKRDDGPMLAIGICDDLAPSMENEARHAAIQLNGRALVGRDATSGRVLKEMAAASFVHMAVHCVFADGHPLSSRVRLHDRWLRASELMDVVAEGSSFVLAGCESGRDSGGGSEDRQGLVWALVAAGAKQVLSSLWPLHDSTSRDVFGRVYDSLGRRGDEPDRCARSLVASLRSAQCSLAGKGVAPWLWGGLQVTGGMP